MLDLTLMGGISDLVSSVDSEGVRVARDEAVDERDEFYCSICTDRPKNSVLTSCGHLYCWSCLYQWLQNQRKPCPVCKFMLGACNIVPVYGCQKESSSSRKESSIPPRPRAACMEADATHRSAGSVLAALNANMTVVGIRRFHLAIRANSEASPQDRRLLALRSRARTVFHIIRALSPPSRIGWITRASHEFSHGFDPSRVSSEDGLLDDLHVFIFDMLVRQGEYYIGIDDFRRTWLPYYEARNPGVSTNEHYVSFLEGWGRHFRAAWIQAGRPSSSFANETQDPTGSLPPRATSSAEAGATAAAPATATAAASHEIPARGSELEVEESDAAASERALQQSGESITRTAREQRRANRRRRPY